MEELQRQANEHKTLIKYINYIKTEIIDMNVDVTLKCNELCDAMKQKFPELIKVRGHIILISPEYIEEEHGKQWPHYWLKTSDGIIIDPTRQQFPGDISYDEWNETKDEPTGKCPNCGGYCYNGASICSERCEQEYTAYLMGNDDEELITDDDLEFIDDRTHKDDNDDEDE